MRRTWAALAASGRSRTTSIVTRADDALRAGDVPAALRLYARARAIDPQSALAADRLAFYAKETNDPSLEPAPLLKKLAAEGKNFASLAAASKAA